jgi:hypothetical protein
MVFGKRHEHTDAPDLRRLLRVRRERPRGSGSAKQRSAAGPCYQNSTYRVTGRGASLEGDRVCAAMERAITQQLPAGGGINVVAASDISLRLASGQPLQCFLPLMRRHLARPSEPNTPFLRSLAALARPSPD